MGINKSSKSTLFFCVSDENSYLYPEGSEYIFVEYISLHTQLTAIMKKFDYVSICIVALICIVTFIDAVHVFDTYRAVQYDNDGEPYGSRKVRVDYLAIAVPNKSAKQIVGSGAETSDDATKKKKR